MKRFFMYIYLFLASSMFYAQDKEIVVVIPSYNNSEWYKWNLDSVFNQTYFLNNPTKCRIIYTDDCSSDGTGDLVEEYVKERGFEKQVTVIKNSTRKFALENLYDMIHSCNDKAIIAVLDGDDAFAATKVLEYINVLYRAKDVWITYGQYQEWPIGKLGFCRTYESDVITNNDFRYVEHGPSHLRTFYAALFKKIKKEDLMIDGSFFQMTYDLAIMFPMLEMAQYHHRFISDVLVHYNVANQLNDHKVNRSLQANLADYIRGKSKYTPLETLFESKKIVKKKVGLLVVATGKYIDFVNPLICSARKHFCTDCDVTYYVFTDGQVPDGADVVKIHQTRMGWPYDTLMRCKLYYDNRDLFKDQEYLFACDADMLFVDIVGQEILSDRVATQHPGFVEKRGSYESSNHSSTAYVSNREGLQYFAGGFHGGSYDEFIALNKKMVEGIEKDLANNFIAVWHDESHLNRYFIDNPPTAILSPSYCYPESWHLPYVKKLLALDKNHDALRK